jgi:hypothetical protein
LRTGFTAKAQRRRKVRRGILETGFMTPKTPLRPLRLHPRLGDYLTLQYAKNELSKNELDMPPHIAYNNTIKDKET